MFRSGEEEGGQREGSARQEKQRVSSSSTSVLDDTDSQSLASSSFYGSSSFVWSSPLGLEPDGVVEMHRRKKRIRERERWETWSFHETQQALFDAWDRRRMELDRLVEMDGSEEPRTEGCVSSRDRPCSSSVVEDRRTHLCGFVFEDRDRRGIRRFLLSDVQTLVERCGREAVHRSRLAARIELRRKTKSVDVSSIPLLSSTLAKMQPSPHMYEIIRDQFPCVAYLDVEYKFIDAPESWKSEAHQERAIQSVVHLIWFGLKTLFGLDASMSDMLILDSTTDEKFSCHIIHRSVKIDDISGDSFCSTQRTPIFASNAEVGSFVGWCLEHLEEAARVDSDIHPRVLYYARRQSFPSETEWTCIVDLGVYTRNRSFRILGSSKFEMDPLGTRSESIFRRHALSTNTNLCTCSSSADYHAHNSTSVMEDMDESQLDDDFFIQSLVTWIPSSLRTSSHDRFLSIPAGLTCHLSRIPGVCYRLLNSSQLGSMSSGFNDKFSNPQGITDSHAFRNLTRFISSCIGKRSGTSSSQTSVSQIRFFGHPQPTSISLRISGSRWCERIGREHRSNAVYWIVDLLRWETYQRCFDPDCHHFESNHIEIPNSIVVELGDILNSHFHLKTDLHNQSPKNISSAADNSICDVLNLIDDDEIEKYCESISL